MTRTAKEAVRDCAKRLHKSGIVEGVMRKCPDINRPQAEHSILSGVARGMTLQEAIDYTVEDWKPVPVSALPKHLRWQR